MPKTDTGGTLNDLLGVGACAGHDNIKFTKNADISPPT